VFDIKNAVDITGCADILPGTVVADEIEPGVCKIKSEFLIVEQVAADKCAGEAQILFVGFTPPTGSEVKIQYVALAN
jgi:hypothetical protein